jgi:hypothetical protein
MRNVVFTAALLYSLSAFADNAAELTKLDIAYRSALSQIGSYNVFPYLDANDRTLCAGQKGLRASLSRASIILAQAKPQFDMTEENPVLVPYLVDVTDSYNKAVNYVREAQTSAKGLNACHPGSDAKNRSAGKPYVLIAVDTTYGAAITLSGALSSLRIVTDGLQNNPNIANYTCTTQTFVGGRFAYQQVFTLNPNSLRWLYAVGPYGLLKEYHQVPESEKSKLGEAVVTISHDMITGEIGFQTEPFKEKKYPSPTTAEFDYVHGNNDSQSKVICYRQKNPFNP